MDIFFILGVVGAGLVLVAFIIGNYHDIDKRTKADEVLNLSGSLLLLLYAIAGAVWPFVVLNAVWAGWSMWLLWEQRKTK